MYMEERICKAKTEEVIVKFSYPTQIMETCFSSSSMVSMLRGKADTNITLLYYTL